MHSITIIVREILFLSVIQFIDNSIFFYHCVYNSNTVNNIHYLFNVMTYYIITKSTIDICNGKFPYCGSSSD